MSDSRPQFRNHILGRLGRSDLALLGPEPVALPVARQLHPQGARIDRVYFIEDGIVSVVAAANGKRAEAGIVGCEGISSVEIVLAGDVSHHDVFMQLGGRGYLVTAPALVKAMSASPFLRRLMLRFVNVFMMQITETMLANTTQPIEARLCRWLLMAQDRLGVDRLPLTHEFLADMLGVRRPGVTVAVNVLVQHGLIEARRGELTITDRTGLILRAGPTYGRAEDEYRRLMG